VYHLLLEQYRQKGQRLWQIEPLLFIFIKSAETNLHITLARLLEPKDRRHGNLGKFFSFCRANVSKIKWIDGELTITLIHEQEAELERHRQTIEHIKARRDKRFAHSDRTYFEDEDQGTQRFLYHRR
jgi:AbiU2